MRRVKVRVPATSSNLGPGFDCLGLALGLYNELTLEVHDEPGETVVEIEGEGASSLPRGRDNATVKAANALLAGRSLGRLVFKCVNRIPLARGLGSSAAAAVAGLVAANELLEPSARLSAEQLVEYAATLEGHPDNAAPAVLGGLVVCARRQKSFVSYPLTPHADLRAVACIPDFELATAKARSVLPHTYLREDAVDNAARTLLLGSALERGLWRRLSVAMEDRFHQPYRAPLVKGMNAVIRAATQASPSCGAALSGAGPTMLALGPAGPDLDHVADAMKRAFADHGVASKTMILVPCKGAEAVD